MRIERKLPRCLEVVHPGTLLVRQETVTEFCHPAEASCVDWVEVRKIMTATSELALNPSRLVLVQGV